MQNNDDEGCAHELSNDLAPEKFLVVDQRDAEKLSSQEVYPREQQCCLEELAPLAFSSLQEVTVPGLVKITSKSVPVPKGMD